MLDHIKILTGNDDEGLIQLLIDKTKLELSATGKQYTFKWDNVIEDIVVLKLNRLGHEGISNTSLDGFSETYIEGYPSYITKQLVALGLPTGKGWVKML